MANTKFDDLALLLIENNVSVTPTGEDGHFTPYDIAGAITNMTQDVPIFTKNCKLELGDHGALTDGYYVIVDDVVIRSGNTRINSGTFYVTKGGKIVTS